ncbi:type VII secretion-associated protein, partial [Mycobacterium lacus]|nr:type VII secretion-associated protein [Mycobacterium lacus]
MTAHRAVIEAGPGTVRRLCCGTGVVAGHELAQMCRAALGAVDDAVALVDERPVAVDSLWRATLRSLDCGHREGILVLHPSWWPASRVGVVTAAAQTLVDHPDDIVARPRSWLLTRASPETSSDVTVVEIADRMVMVVGAEAAAVPRRTGAHPIAEEVAGVISGMTPAVTAVVLIDAPSTVTGAGALAASIADAVRGGGTRVLEVDDARLARLARAAAQAARDEPARPSVTGSAAR